jgi:hypothetical protein
MPLKVFCKRDWCHLGTGQVGTEFYSGDRKERNHLEDLGVDRKITLNGSLRSGMWMYALD